MQGNSVSGVTFGYALLDVVIGQDLKPKSEKKTAWSWSVTISRHLSKHFSDEEIIELGLFCAEVDGVGKFVKSLNVLSWEEACELNPKLTQGATTRVAAE